MLRKLIFILRLLHNNWNQSFPQLIHLSRWLSKSWQKLKLIIYIDLYVQVKILNLRFLILFAASWLNPKSFFIFTQETMAIIIDHRIQGHLSYYNKVTNIMKEPSHDETPRQNDRNIIEINNIDIIANANTWDTRLLYVRNIYF